MGEIKEIFRICDLDHDNHISAEVKLYVYHDILGMG
jgi:hypothetical protein